MKNKIKEIITKNKEIMSYLIVGVLTTVISLTSYFLLVHTFLNPNHAIEIQIANILSWILAVTFAYITNRIFVFKSQSQHYLKEIMSFVSSRILTLLMDMGIMFVFVTLLHNSDTIGKLISQVVVTIANYLFSKLFVFRGDKKCEQ